MLNRNADKVESLLDKTLKLDKDHWRASIVFNNDSEIKGPLLLLEGLHEPGYWSFRYAYYANKESGQIYRLNAINLAYHNCCFLSYPISFSEAMKIEQDVCNSGCVITGNPFSPKLFSQQTVTDNNDYAYRWIRETLLGLFKKRGENAPPVPANLAAFKSEAVVLQDTVGYRVIGW